jgi:hypothetical protein
VRPIERNLTKQRDIAGSNRKRRIPEVKNSRIGVTFVTLATNVPNAI